MPVLVAKYKILKSHLDDIGNTNPAIKKWIQWWDDRRSHIFTLYRGRGLPGVNLSEQGNAGWVTCQMHLVHAAKYDVSTMMTQEKQVFKFDQNLETSTGCGPTQAVHASCDRSEQVTIGEEFVEIISDEEAIEEGRQAWEPAGFIPKKKCKPRPKQVKLVQEESTQKKLTTKPVTTKDRKSRKCKAQEETSEEVEVGTTVEDSSQARNNLPNHATQMNKKLQQAANIIQGSQSTEQEPAQPGAVGQPAQPGTVGQPGTAEQAVQPGTAGQPPQASNPEIERYRVPNPPIVILTGTNIRMCKGCGKAITWNDKQYPYNMVFTKRGITGYLNRKTNMYINKISNIHFHLKIKCIRDHDHTVKLCEIMINEEVFANLSTEQMEELNKRGINTSLII